MPISAELQARIDALPDENLRANITRRLNRTWPRTKSNEQIFDEMISHHQEVMAERAARDARLYKWSEDEVMAFIEYFRESHPQWHSDYLQQERNDREIDADLALSMRRLAEQWKPGLDWDDYCELFSMVRDYAEVHLI
ncbi:hypothetical protein [Sphingomonas sp.]|uniref:hypothetical protein n=1 Tax=Sphingomonas sp. TaxID=28214 RepID=UPI0035B08722